MSTPARPVESDVHVLLRPLGTPLPLGFLGQVVASLSFSALQLGWVSESQSHTIALAVLVMTVPAQALASVLGFFARDPVAGTGMAILSGAWAAICATTYSSPPGSTSAGLGVVLVALGGVMLVPTVAGHAKTVAALVMAVTAARFTTTGLAELIGTRAWLLTAGWVGLALSALSFYAALAFEIEGTQKREVLPLWRTGRAARAVGDDEQADLDGVAREPGVRSQL